MKKRIGIILTVILSCTLGVGITLALLSSVSRPVVNTFTIGEVSISLDESTGTNYKMIPGVTHEKDPSITVHKGSEACWLFFKIEKSVDFDDYVTYLIAQGWTPLDSDPSVYWRSVPATSDDCVFHLLLDDKVTIKDTVTEQKLASLSRVPTIKFYAYAIQSEGIDSPTIAWQNVSQ